MKKRFTLSIRTAFVGETHPDLARVQSYLRRFGYLGRRVATAPGTLDAPSSRALAALQARMGLEPTGRLDERTAQIIEAPRCANLDATRTEPAPFVLYPCSYKKLSFTYRFATGTADLPGSDEQAPVARAFATWSDALCDISFREASDVTDFVIGWYAGSHGDGYPFDGPGNVIAHAFFPPCGSTTSGAGMHFDEAESWTINGGGFDLETVALHEIGHLLGLEHSSDPMSVMFPTYQGVRRTLGTDDVAGVRRLYPWLCRRASSGQAGLATSELDVTHGASNEQLVTVDRASTGRLRVSSWRRETSTVVRTGDSGNLAGGVAQVRVARVPGTTRYVTAGVVTTSSARLLKIITWNVDGAGHITRIGDSDPVSVRATSPSIVCIDALTVVTAAREESSGRLLIQSWRLGIDGTLILLGSGRSSAPIDEVALVDLGLRRVATGTRLTKTGALYIVTWTIGLDGSVRRDETGSEPGAAADLALTTDQYGRVISAVRRSTGNLRLTSWDVDGAQVTRLRDSGSLGEAATEHDVSFAFGHVVTSLRTTAGVQKTVAWRTTSVGEIERIGDSAFVGDPADRIAVSGSITDAVVAARVGGIVQLSAWAPPAG